jgi:hypothetical protein
MSNVDMRYQWWSQTAAGDPDEAYQPPDNPVAIAVSLVVNKSGG